MDQTILTSLSPRQEMILQLLVKELGLPFTNCHFSAADIYAIAQKMEAEKWTEMKLHDTGVALFSLQQICHRARRQVGEKVEFKIVSDTRTADADYEGNMAIFETPFFYT